MRRGVLLLSILLLAGCHCEKKPSPTTQALSEPEPAFDDARIASALVFAPPIAQSEPSVDLSRDSRQPAAFVGYDDLIRTFIYVRTDDRWSADGTDQYERRAITEKVGASTR